MRLKILSPQCSILTSRHALRSRSSRTMVVARIAVEVSGEGEPVLMIHGLGGTTNTWTTLLPAFSRNRCVRFDLPGSGRSSRCEGALSTEVFVQACLKVMKAAG